MRGIVNPIMEAKQKPRYVRGFLSRENGRGNNVQPLMISTQ